MGEKVRYLREIEGTLRGLGRAMTQQELLSAVKKETRQTISQSYLSQIESGSRPHITNKTRNVLASFFKVHPGYLVGDPEGYQVELQSELRNQENSLDVWLYQGADRFETQDAELSEALIAIAKQDDSRQCLLLLQRIVEDPRLKLKLMDVLHTVHANGKAGRQ